jgi:DNA-binding transcriptional LysR family regulator
MTLRQLAYLVALADVGSFTRAADLVGVAQPTLSRQLRALEDDLGAPLVERGGRDGTTLTAAGEAVLPFARRMLADADGARTAVAELIGLRRGRVRLGATPSLCVGVVADVLRAFHGAHPEIALELVESGSQPLVRALARGELDIALVIVPADGIEPGLAAAPLLRERLSVASAATEPAPFRRGSVTVVELARRPLVVPREGYDLRAATLRAFDQAGATPRLAVQGGEMDAVLRLVEAGTGLAVVPDIVFGGRPGLRRTAWVGATSSRWASATVRYSGGFSAVRAFRDTLLGFLGELSARGGLVGDVQVLARPGSGTTAGSVAPG